MLRDLDGKVAVITGGARGIGAAMGRRFAENGMKVVITDVLEEQLEETEKELQGAGLDVTAIPSDVTSLASVEALRDATVAKYGAAHLICNNAGVSSGATGKVWEYDMKDWAWAFDVNVYGVLHGIKAFTPLLLEQGDGHIVNTSSGNGGLLTSPTGSAIYPTTKSALVTITECLWFQLQELDTTVGTSVLFPSTRTPGLLKTGIWQPGTNRPERYAKDNDPNPEGFDTLKPFMETMEKAGREVQFAPLEEIGDIVYEGVQEDKFWISAHDGQGSIDRLQARMDSQVNGTAPTYLLGGMGGRSEATKSE